MLAYEFHPLAVRELTAAIDPNHALWVPDSGFAASGMTEVGKSRDPPPNRHPGRRAGIHQLKRNRRDVDDGTELLR
jgi:hypothetical protein